MSFPSVQPIYLCLNLISYLFLHNLSLYFNLGYNHLNNLQNPPLSQKYNCTADVWKITNNISNNIYHQNHMHYQHHHNHNHHHCQQQTSTSLPPKTRLWVPLVTRYCTQLSEELSEPRVCLHVFPRMGGIQKVKGKNNVVRNLEEGCTHTRG